MNFTSANTFRYFMKMISDQTMLPGIGLVIVNQEGEQEAGKPGSSFQTRDTEFEENAKKIATELSACLTEGRDPDESTMSSLNGFCVPVIGSFRTIVGYFFSIGNPAQHSDIIDEFVKHVSLAMENSKKSEFHKKFTKNISDTVLGNLFALISDTITQGLYANKVVVWELDGEKLIAHNHPNYNMLVTNSLCGKVVEDGLPRTVDNISDYPGPIFLKEELIKDGLSAFFLLPVHSTVEGKTVGVVGVFYSRPFGTTDVDLELALYVVRYFQVIWDTISRNVSLEAINQLDEEARSFHTDAVRCILKLHEISDIRMGLQIAYDELDSRTSSHSDPLVRENVKLFSEQLRLLRNLHSSQEQVFRQAEDYVQMVIAREERKNETIDLAAFVDETLNGLRLSAEAMDVEVSIEYALTKKRYYLDKQDLSTIVTNFVSNGIRAIEKRKNYQENSIDVSIRDLGREIEIVVEDTGVGIAPYELEKIFDPHYTTNRDVGGQGLGLAVLKATCLKHGNVPKVTSKWGYGSEATARMRHF